VRGGDLRSGFERGLRVGDAATFRVRIG